MSASAVLNSSTLANKATPFYGTGGTPVVAGVESINGAIGVVVQTGVQGINVYGNIFGVGDLLPTSVVAAGNITGTSLTATTTIVTPLIAALSLGATAATVGNAPASSGGGATKRTMVIAGWRLTWGQIQVYPEGAAAGRGYVDFPVPYQTGMTQSDVICCLSQGLANGGVASASMDGGTPPYLCNNTRLSIFTDKPGSSPTFSYLFIGPA